MIRVAVVGLGKMGISHLALLGAHPKVELAAVCDSSKYILSTLHRYTGVATHSDFDKMIREVELDAVVIATPTRTHARHGPERAGEKCPRLLREAVHARAGPMPKSSRRSRRERALVTQVGYHNRFVGAFREVKALLEAGAIGTVTHALGEAYGPVCSSRRARPGAASGPRAAAASTTTPPTRSTC